MKISYNWLKEHLPLDLPASDLAERLLQLGFEVSSRERRGPAFSGVVAAEILAVEKHPNADRLSLCVVGDGRAKFSVVCGARNVAVGQKVALARVGALLPGGRRIERALIRGVESQGMICSAQELCVEGRPGDGILVLDPQTQPGSDPAQALAPSDDILEVEITPNRPDCLSHLGLARELAAYFRMPLKPRPAAHAQPPEGACLPIDVKEPQACPRYLGRVLTGLKVAPSPGWLAAKLEAVGLRPINNVVDATNYILMDMGQPLHAFDLDALEGGRVEVRFAAPGERILALDGRDYALTPECLVIADAKRPQAVAGVMGGERSAVTAKTARAFLESAYFSPPVIRKTSQTLRLRSDSSTRFERGADIEAVSAASERASALILELCGPQARASEAADSGRKHAQHAPILVSSGRVNAILGSDFPEESVAQVVEALSAGLEKRGDALKFSPPSYRGDLATPWDLAEEVGRMLSYDNIPSRAAPVPPRPTRALRSQSLAEACRRRLAGLGLLEAYNYDFVSDKLLAAARLADASQARVANPLSEDWTTLRPSLLPGLLQNAVSNLNRGAQSVRLFELGKAYALDESGGVGERARLGAVLLGPVAEAFWKPERCPRGGLYEAKGVVAELVSNIPGLAWAPLTDPEAGGAAADPLFHPGASLRLLAPGGALGCVGLLHPAAARALGLEREEAALFELDLEALGGLQAPETRLKAVSPFPSVKRDISIVLDAKIPYAEAEAAVGQAAILKAVELVDLFAGRGIPAGKRSLTLRLTFGRDDRTLTDPEVNSAVEGILESLKSRLGAALRS